METKEFAVNEIVHDFVNKIDDEYMDDMIMSDINLEDTLELSVDDVMAAFENTTLIDLGKEGRNDG